MLHDKEGKYADNTYGLYPADWELLSKMVFELRCKILKLLMMMAYLLILVKPKLCCIDRTGYKIAILTYTYWIICLTDLKFIVPAEIEVEVDVVTLIIKPKHKFCLTWNCLAS